MSRFRFFLILAIGLLAAVPVLGARDDYKLVQVAVFSRHNIRTPLTRPGSVTDSLLADGRSWHNWSAPAGELSLKGGMAETAMGQYFGRWLEEEGLIPRNWQPSEREALFYANSLQRTRATARYFASGMMPTARINVKYRPHIRNRVFLPLLTTCSDAFQAEARREQKLLESGLQDSLARSFAVLERVLGLESSPWFRVHGKHMVPEPVSIVYTKGEEPNIRSGSLRIGTHASDALVLQYYEKQDLQEAAFGNDLTLGDWQRIASVKDVFIDMLFGLPIVGLNAATGMLEELVKELSAGGRKFTYLCGHDSSVNSIMTALGAYCTEDIKAIEKRAPLGGKLVFEKYLKEGTLYARLRLIYPGIEQLRAPEALSPDNPPCVCPILLKGLQANEDGFYSYSDLLGRMKEAIKAGKQAGSGILPDYLR